MMALSRTTITRSILVAAGVAVLGESAMLLLADTAIPTPIYALTLTLATVAAVAHLAALVISRVEDVGDQVQGRLDDFEVNGLHALLSREHRSTR